MIVFGRLVVAMFVAMLFTAVFIAVWSGILFSLQPHWVFHVLFMLGALVLHFFVVRLAYVQIKRKWF